MGFFSSAHNRLRLLVACFFDTACLLVNFLLFCLSISLCLFVACLVLGCRIWQPFFCILVVLAKLSRPYLRGLSCFFRCCLRCRSRLLCVFVFGELARYFFTPLVCYPASFSFVCLLIISLFCCCFLLSCLSVTFLSCSFLAFIVLSSLFVSKSLSSITLLFFLFPHTLSVAGFWLPCSNCLSLLVASASCALSSCPLISD